MSARIGFLSGRLVGLWPWVALLLVLVPAVWHVVDFPEDIDEEFPKVVRPTFCRRPPPAYRLAEPGDTIDRVAIYLAAGAVVLAAIGWGRSRTLGRGSGLWPTALLLALAAAWHAATPGPTFDGWHGLGWRAIGDPSAPIGVRLTLAAAAIGVTVLVAGSIGWQRERLGEYLAWGRARGVLGLLGASLVLVLLRQVEIPGVEPAGYWPRWAYLAGVLALDLALIRALPPWPAGWAARGALAAGGALAWFTLVVGGIALTWYHRPIARLRAVVPGRIFISAMPTYRGLAIAHQRHRFKTIINLFPENTPLRSPHYPDELRFAREHGIRYVLTPHTALQSDAFLDLTLALAQDPNAWPILVHCHGCVDRSPAWMGIYRFVVEGRPLEEVMREIEQHRGYRPKASVTLLYNRVLPPRAPQRYAQDPTAQRLKRCAEGTVDPFYAQYRKELEAARREARSSITGPRSLDTCAAASDTPRDK
ncbi:MAG: protein tyrosine phosphatase [Isosphaeraceae bacterium]|nr:protein tyrosine phosphatase [Isosphaeraceae bacterium]